MKRNTIVGAGFFAGALLLWGCGTILGLPEGDVHTECLGNDVRCSGNGVQKCVNGLWTNPEPCPNACVDGACVGECEPGAKKCLGNYPQECDSSGHWKNAIPCTIWEPFCDAEKCKVPPSCEWLAETCGPLGNESCCTVTELPGGTYNRGNDMNYPATVSAFQLDRFEITVGRFREFVGAYPASKPIENAGKHPLIDGSGWKAEWDMELPADQAALLSALKCDPMFHTWTDGAGANENLPMNCITWFEAFAFCAWDGGRLPTEAEWNYAAAGGNEQRYFPWSSPPDSMVFDSSYAVYNCEGVGASDCVFDDILEVGSKSPRGDGKWSQADLGGSMWEWILDGYDPTFNEECNNCAKLMDVSFRVTRGGYWGNSIMHLRSSYDDGHGPPATRQSYLGARCARDLRPPPEPTP